MEGEILELMAGRRGRGGEESYGSSMKTSTAVYKDSGIDTSHTRNFVFLTSPFRFVSLSFFFLAAGRGYRLVSGVPDCRDRDWYLIFPPPTGSKAVFHQSKSASV